MCDLDKLRLKSVSLEEHLERLKDDSMVIDLPINDNNDKKTFELWKVHSIWPQMRDAKNYYHLHPEFVEKVSSAHNMTGDHATYYVRICKTCCDSLDKKDTDDKEEDECVIPGDADDATSAPQFSVKKVDFGCYQRLGLEPLSVMERHIISKYRLYSQIIKIESNTGRQTEHRQSSLKGCCILFDHDSPRIAKDLLSEKTMGEDICIQFVGPKGEYDKLLTRTKNSKSSHIFGRAWVVYQWMAVLKKLHCLYKSEPALVSLNEMKRRIKQTVGILLSQTINTFDDACLNAMNIARDDVAEIRASSTNNRLLPASDDPCQKKDNVDSFAVNDEAPLALRYCYVTNSDKTTHGSKSDSTHEYLSGAARTIRMDVEEERRSYSERVNMSRRSVAPMDEFTQSNEILTGSNPDVFILGNAYGRTKGALSEKEATHLLLQFTNNASSCRTLLFLLFDQRQRHSVIGQMHVKIRQDAAAFEKFTKLFTSEGFQTKLRMGIANPEGKQAKEVLKKLIPVLTSGGKKTVFGALERRAAAGEILAMGRAYGAASNFLTVSVDDMHTPGVFRLAF